MFFGRLRVPLAEYEASSAPAKERAKSGVHRLALVRLVRGDSPRRPPSQPEHAPCEDEFAGLDRLDRDELDDE